jgi:ribosomal protein L7/L12
MSGASKNQIGAKEADCGNKKLKIILQSESASKVQVIKVYERRKI